VVAAVPFLRPLDLPRAAEPMAAVRAVYGAVLAEARARQGGRPLMATGHLFVTGCTPSILSERRIITGGQEAVPVEVFPDDVAYVALGHLHRAQRVGGREHVRYAGSPIPLAMNEAGYRHQVAIADLPDGPGEPAQVRIVEVPRTVELVRVPRTGALSLADALAALSELEAFDPDEDAELRPYLEVVVALERPEPRLRALVEDAMAGKRPRLVKITAGHTGDGRALADAVAGVALADLDPRDVFVRKWQRHHEGAPTPALLARFDALVEEVRRGGSP